MKRTRTLFGILLMVLAPCMVLGQGVQPSGQAMIPLAARTPYLTGPMAAGNRQFLPRNMYQPTTNSNFNLSVPSLAPGFEIYAGILLLQPGADNLGWAVITNVKNPSSPVPVASPFWGIQTLTASYQPGLEVGARHTFANSGNDLHVNWQDLRTTTTSSVGAIEGLQWVSPFCQTGPSSAQTFADLSLSQGVNKLRSAEGQVKFAYDVVNLDFGQYVNVGSSMVVRMFGGVSFARLREELVSSFFGAPPDPAAVFPLSTPLFISLNNTSTYSGVGPRFGFDATYAIPYGIRLTGQMAGALLIGRKQPAQYLFNAISPDLAAVGLTSNPEQISSGDFIQVVYSCDGRLGLCGSHAFCDGSTLTFEAGYTAAVYVDPFSGYETNHNVLPLQIGSLSTASMRHTLSNFTLNGLYVEGGFKW